MKSLFFLLGMSLFLTGASHSASKGAIALFFSAEKESEAGRREEALAKYIRVIELAREEGLPIYQASAAKNVAFEMNRQANGVETVAYGQMAGDVYQQAENRGESWTQKLWAKLGHVQVKGLVERGYYHQGRLGMAWQTNHETYRLWLRTGGLPDRGGAFESANLRRVPATFVSTGLRIHEREAEYLHFVGRTQEALDLLESSLASVNPALLRNDRAARGYHQKLLAQQSLIRGFIGEEELAIESWRKQITAMGTEPSMRHSSLIARLNLLRERMDIEGLGEEDYKEAEEVARELRARGEAETIGLDRTLAAIYYFRNSREERLALLNAAKDSPSSLEAFYAGRELLFDRSADGEEGLESEYFALLADIRSKGNKRAEPRVYRRYGDWLATQGRWSEARSSLRESLRMTFQFGWIQKVPELKERLATLYLMQGDLATARVAWEEADEFYRTEEGLNPRQIVKAWRLRLWGLLRAGMTEEASALARRALALGREAGLAENLLENFQTADFAALGKVLGEKGFEISVDPEVSPGLSVRLQPSLVTTVAESERNARAVFFLINSGEKCMEGEMVVECDSPLSGELTAEGGVKVFVGGSESVRELSLPLSLEGGEMREILLEGLSVGVKRDEKGLAQLSVQWRGHGVNPIDSKWQFSWGEKATEFSVLDAMAVSGNPFKGLPMRHHFAIPEALTEAIPVRLRLEKAEEELYLEYRAPGTGEIVAVDVDGDGDFTGQGDFCEPSEDDGALRGPLVKDRMEGLEVWLFHSGGSAPSGEGELVIEYHRDGQWLETGRNTFHFGEDS